MNEQKLSLRLEKVASFIEPESRIADIGSDHAYLPCFAVLKKLASFAVAGEIALGPLKSAEEQVEKTGLREQIIVRKGDGLEVIQAEDQIDTIVIAGMGGPLIASILEQGKSKLEGVKRLILQPNIAANRIREWGVKNHFRITAETILSEDHKIYEILVLEPSEMALEYSEQELIFGPLLLQEKNQVFREKWRHEQEIWQKIIQNIENEGGDVAKQAKIAELTAKIKLAEDVLK
ncbi:hypothetical protein MFLO_03480 [Listeria floridensis FSL S10-1187]|uniref:SAM-dependent methyltransferase n=1 Tax=Listeria floridensis FSL S10-1187 TaxID=1265817 RepID=A0ABN0RHG6_9LIST|nr:tRNA (adenine(22)-N(1))-methyltransferase TrmK [Listeria floridensis]EUJ33364.1 hypothetical protein MFLO_03480 [Listeria floridensis FSL S10-1187]